MINHFIDMQYYTRNYNTSENPPKYQTNEPGRYQGSYFSSDISLETILPSYRESEDALDHHLNNESRFKQSHKRMIVKSIWKIFFCWVLLVSLIAIFAVMFMQSFTVVSD